MNFDDDYVKLVKVVNHRENIEKPHYDYLVGGQKYSLIMQENIDSVEYRDGLTKTLSIALEHNHDMTDFIESKRNIKNLILEDLHSFHKIRKFLVNIQTHFNEQHIEKAMKAKYGVSENLVDVVSVNFNRNELRLRLNYQKDGFIHHGILSHIGIVNVYVAEQDDKKKALADFLEVFNREYKKNNILQKNIQEYQRKCFIRYDTSKDVLADKFLASQISNFATSVAYRANGIIMTEEYDRESNIKQLNAEKDKIDTELQKKMEYQNERNNRFFGLGKFIDKYLYTEDYNSRMDEYKLLENKKLSYDREIEVLSKPSEDNKRFFGEVKKAYDKEIAILTMKDKKDLSKASQLKTVKTKEEELGI